MSSRAERERAFHDDTFANETRASASKFYDVLGQDLEHYKAELLRGIESSDAKVLEIGCGPNSYATLLANQGAHVVGIDISPVAVEQATAEAERQGVADRCEFAVMDAEELTHPDGSVDLVCGSGILHHLDLGPVFREMARVLKPTGRGVFFEPLGHNPAINAYRNRTPELRTEDEHPLLIQDLEFARGYFGDVRTEFFHLSTLAAIPLRKTRAFQPIRRGLENLDSVLLRSRRLRKYAWIVVVSLSDPKPPPAQS